METGNAANQLLKNKYDLHKSPEVENAAKRTRMRTGEKVPQDPLIRIQNYLNRFHEIIDQKDPEKRERGIQVVKKVLLDKFVTKFEEIPDSYWKSQESILHERGQQGDYNRFSEEEKNKWKKEISQGLLADQRASLEQWIDYLSSEESAYMPDAMKYWVFRNVINMQEYDKEKQDYPQRSEGTVKMFPDINHEALSYVIDAVVKKYKGENFSFGSFEFDLTDEQKRQFQQSLQRENFSSLYAWANEQITPIPKHLLPVTDGKWIKYEQNSDHLSLVKSIRGRGTGWCIAGDSVAQNYLKAGDLYVFYSNDDNKNPTIPRIAIRMEEARIAEVRGIAYRQNLDSYMGDVLEIKLNEFPNKDQYLKKESDMKYLTAIEHQIKEGQHLSSQDLRFLYEIDSPIEGFGYSKDPRIKELRDQRNPAEDMPVVFGCSKEQIAKTPNEINPATKAYVGSLVHRDSKGAIIPIFKKIGHLDHIYTSFPEGRIKRETVSIGGKTSKELIELLKEGKINIAQYAEDMIKSKDFVTLQKPKTITLISLRVGQMGLEGTPTTDEVYERKSTLGLELCPAEVGPHYRLAYTNQSMNEWRYIGMKQIADRDGSPHVFELYRTEGGVWLDSDWAVPSYEWDPLSAFVFSLSKVETKNPGFFDRILKR